MKLAFPQNQVETSCPFATKDFDFGDKRIIMNILRSKMYSRPVYIICQEIMANCRDANREMGRGDRPIVVTLPSKMDPMIHFKDNGPGITPDRMENIFIKYGNSTKRADNNQTGGFGLGAKTPFAYSDTFTITTITSEGGKKTRREYIAFIGENQIGSMSEISATETDDDTGTTISIGVQNKDITEFVNSVVEVGRFWEPHPELKNHPHGAFSFPKSEYVVKGSGWGINNADNEPKAIIDGVSYKIDRNAIAGKKVDDDYSYSYNASNRHAASLLNTGLHLFFKTGELRVTANREALDYQEDVVKAINDRVEVAKKEISDVISKELAASPNLWEASLKWQELQSVRSYGNYANPKWNNEDILLKGLEIPPWFQNNTWDARPHIKLTVWESDGAMVSASKPRWGRIHKNIPLEKGILIVTNKNDKEKPNKLRLMTLFNQANGAYTKIGVVTYGFTDATNTAEAEKFLEKEFKLSLLGAMDLTTISKTKVAKGTRGSHTIVPVKVLTESKSRRGSTYSFDSAAGLNINLDDPAGGTYVIIKDGEPQFDGKKLPASAFWNLHVKLHEPNPAPKLYGILTKFKNKIGPQWTNFETAVKDKINELKSDKDVKLYVSLGGDDSAKDFFNEDGVFDELVKDISSFDANCQFFSWIASAEKCKDAKEKIEKHNELVNNCNRYTEAISFSANKTSMLEKIFTQYPLLRIQYRRYSSYMTSDNYKTAISQYVKLIDKETSNGSVNATNP